MGLKLSTPIQNVGREAVLVLNPEPYRSSSFTVIGILLLRNGDGEEHVISPEIARFSSSLDQNHLATKLGFRIQISSDLSLFSLRPQKLQQQGWVWKEKEDCASFSFKAWRKTPKHAERGGRGLMEKHLCSKYLVL
ncbi:hypothetical protein H6P81_002675 [Aristolochia fimbriata]|uniref:Uncharacterized protein n=1 Tax=Aristolochia fimbriata TaxID=158543 RepID=A0AAV7FAE3_ARIFI|nr:hypothetical protein H6P81_002675 [Aristolochia fimbriata]